MYEAADDPYCYPGTSVLKNRLGLRDQAELNSFEALITTQRSDEPLRLGPLDVDGYRGIHRHLFQDVYDWAGEFRTVRIARQGSMFCYPEHIDREMDLVFDALAAGDEFKGLQPAAFASRAAHLLSDLNAIHPFREGNGRTQNVFLTILAERAGHPLELGRLRPQELLDAMIAGFSGNEQPLGDLIASLIRGQF